MPRARNPNRDKAYQIWLEHKGTITNRQLAEMLGENEKVIAVWKQRDKWNVVQQTNESCTTNKITKKRGAPKGSKNALGNDGGPPENNQNATKHGFFRRIFPDDEETLAIIDEIQIKKPIDILWENIIIQYTAIARAQKIMFVNDQDDMTKWIKKQRTMGENVTETEFEIQFSWEKQANFLQAQSRAISTLQNQIKKYEEMLPNSLENEEQRLRIEKLKAELSNMTGEDEDDNITSLAEIIKLSAEMVKKNES